MYLAKELEDRIKNDVRNYILNIKMIQEKTSVVHDFLINKILSQIGKELVISNHRNYRHSDELTFTFHSIKGLIPCPINEKDEILLLSNEKGELYILSIYLSDIGNYASYFWNKKTLEIDSLEVQYFEDKLPPEVEKIKNKIFQVILDQKFLLFNESELLEVKKDWIEDILTVSEYDSKGNVYKPKIFELMFGSFELYTLTNIAS